MFLSDSTIENSFEKLQQRVKGGKKGLECTSALMYFLAFDAIIKSRNVKPPIDFDPDSRDGKLFRQLITVYFAKFVRIRKSADSGDLQITNLGIVDKNGTPPEKRISSNFLTVPLKKAAQAKNALGYPQRPAPLLYLGKVGDSFNWGIDYHTGWKIVFMKFIDGRKTRTPFVDLAIIILRDDDLKGSQGNVLDAIYKGLKEKFTTPLAEYWISHIQWENKTTYFPKIELQDQKSKVLESVAWQMTEKKKTEQEISLLKRIVYLEGILRKKGISY